MLTIICGRSGSGKSTWIMSRILESVKNREDGQILIVPEQFSHEAERRLASFCGDSLSLYAEVLSFSRLANRVFTECGGLGDVIPDKGGKMLMMYLALKNISDQLGIYGRQAGKSEFIEGLLKAREELSSCMIEPGRLRQAAELAEGSVRDKLLDMALICESYEAVLVSRNIDPRDRLLRLAALIGGSSIGNEGHIYIDSFTDFTRQELEVIDMLMKKGADITVALCLEEDGSEVFKVPQITLNRLSDMAKRRHIDVNVYRLAGRMGECADSLCYLDRALFDYTAPRYTEKCDDIELYAMNDIVSECELAAARALDMLRSDKTLRCRDIAVAAGDFEKYEAICESVFRLYGLPVYISGKTNIMQRSVVTLVTEALEIVTGGWLYRNVFRYLKTNLTDIERDHIDLLENYCVTWNIRGETTWAGDKPWTMNPRGYITDRTGEDIELLRLLEEIRLSVAAPLKRLRENGRSAKNAGQQVMALYSFIEDIKLAERLSEVSGQLLQKGERQLADEYGQLWDILIEALEQCEDILGDTPMDQEEFKGLLELVLSQYDVGTIPVAIDIISMGSLESVREKNLRCLMVLGATDDALPRIAGSGGVFTAEERRALNELGLELKDGDDEEICRQLHSVYAALTKPTQRLIVTYPQSSGDSRSRPSYVAERIASIYNIKPVYEPELNDGFRTAAPGPAYQLALSGKDNAAARASGIAISRQKEWAGKLEDVRQTARAPRGSLSPNSVKGLFGKAFNISATRIEKYNSCRFSYFMQYGLKARQRKKAGFEAPEMGTLVHYVLENFTREVEEMGGFKDCDADMCKRLAGKYMDKYARELLGDAKKSKRFMFLFTRLRQTVERIVIDVADELAHSDFKPLDFELSFARDGDLPPAVLQNENMHIEISGFVDRVDGWLKGDRLYLRVCDYKTGKKEFSLSDIWYGMGLQMLIYLFVLEKHGRERYDSGIVPAGVLYAPARDIILQLPRNTDMETIEKLRARQLKRSGLILDDPDVIEAMENGDEPARIPVKFKNGRPGGSLASAEQLGRLGKYIEGLLIRLGDEMQKGSIDANPFVSGGMLISCQYCEFKDACQFDEKRDNPRRFVNISSDEFWERLNKPD